MIGTIRSLLGADTFENASKELQGYLGGTDAVFITFTDAVIFLNSLGNRHGKNVSNSSRLRHYGTLCILRMSLATPLSLVVGPMSMIERLGI